MQRQRGLYKTTQVAKVASVRPPQRAGLGVDPRAVYEQAFKTYKEQVGPQAQALLAAKQAEATAASVPQDRESVRSMVRDYAAKTYGWTDAEWDALDRLIMKESGYNPTAQNPKSSAFGIFQFLDRTWQGYGVPKTADPHQQTVAGLRYIKARYGTPSKALAFHLRNNWY